MCEIIRDRIICDKNLRFIIEEVVLEATVASSEDLLEDIQELIGTHNDGNILINEEELFINFYLRVLNILSKDRLH